MKTILPEYASCSDFELMFQEEAQLAARIRHPNVCEVFELIESDGVLALSMEWVDGDTLSRVLNASSQPLPCKIAAHIVAQAAAGLHAAHELRDDRGVLMNVVHRDVSAQNILISREGHIKISDFGIAKALGSARDSTKTGHVRGKRSYISPEHALGLPTDRRSDVFSLGVVLYLATAGRFPFREDGCATEAPMARLLSARCLPPSRVCSGYPLELEWIVMRALARDPAARFPSADAMRSALEQYMLRSGAFVTDRDVARVLIERRGAEIAKREQRVRLLSAASEAATSCAGFSQTLDPVLPCSRTLSPPLSWRAAGRQALLVLAVSALGTAVGIGTKARTGSGAHSAALLGRAGLHMRVGSAASMAATGSQTAARAASDGDAAALGASASPAQASTEPSAIQIWLPGKSRSKTTEESSVGAALPARLGASPSTHDSRALRAHRTERVFSVQPSSGASPDNMNLGDVRPGVAAAPGMPPPAAAAAPRKVAPSQADPPRVPIGPLEQEL